MNSIRDDGARSMEKVRKKYDDFLKLLHVREFRLVD